MLPHRAPFSFMLCSTDGLVLHTTADASYVCTHRGKCNKLWNVMWHDHGNFEEHLRGLQSFQHYSHLPGLSFFARKVCRTRVTALYRKIIVALLHIPYVQRRCAVRAECSVIS